MRYFEDASDSRPTQPGQGGEVSGRDRVAVVDAAIALAPVADAATPLGVQDERHVPAGGVCDESVRFIHQHGDELLGREERVRIWPARKDEDGMRKMQLVEVGGQLHTEYRFEVHKHGVPTTLECVPEAVRQVGGACAMW
jgi:hypothetical protein